MKKVIINMEENMFRYFITGCDLSTLIRSQTNEGKFVCRDFVEPLVQFCLDGNYTARIGIVYGLRSTGKTVGMLHAFAMACKRYFVVSQVCPVFDKLGKFLRV